MSQPPLAMSTLDCPLVGAGGEPVDLRRTFLSHGIASLPPFRFDQASNALEVTLPLRRGRPRTVRIRQIDSARAVVAIVGRPVSHRSRAELWLQVRRVLALDRDLSPFYSLVATDSDLAWAARGAGRMIQSPTVFEEVVKTICTTNCSWGATVRMVNALVMHLGERAPGAPAASPYGRTFPTARAMAEASEDFYRDVVRSGYRGRYLIELASRVASDSLDLEELARSDPRDVPDDHLEKQLLALPGVGPYAAAHIMLMLGHHSRLILDSWTRPKYARLVGRRSVPDATITRRFRRYGDHAGLAFWLFVTKDWIEEDGLDHAP